MEVGSSNTRIFQEPNSDQVQLLRSRLGAHKFEDEQWQAIKCLLYDRRDCFLFANSRYPKDIIYQFIAVSSDKIVIVFTHLTNEITKQMQNLTAKHIKSFEMNPQQNMNVNLDRQNIIFVDMDAHLKTIENHLKTLRAMKDKIGLIVIEESQFISKFNHKIRQNHSTLKKLKDIFIKVPILAMASVPTEIIRTHVIAELKLQDPEIIKTNLDIPNVKLAASSTINTYSQMISEVNLPEKNEDRTIIIVLNQREAERLQKQIQMPSKIYHSGLTKIERRQIAEEFRRGEFKVLCTTSLNHELLCNEIRRIFCQGFPRSMEALYEIIDATGRDGKPSSCSIFFANNSSYAQLYESMQVEEHEKCSRTTMIRNYCEPTLLKCRRGVLLKYFEGDRAVLSQEEIYETCCDFCERKVHFIVPSNLLYHGLDENGMLDVTDDARDLLNLVQIFHSPVMIDFLCGIYFDGATLFPRKAFKYFGKGSKKSREYWSDLFSFIALQNMIRNFRSAHFQTDLMLLNAKGKEFCYCKQRRLAVDPKKLYYFFTHLKRTDKLFMIQTVNGKETYKCINENHDQEIEYINDQKSGTNNLKRKISATAQNAELFSFTTKSKKIQSDQLDGENKNLLVTTEKGSSNSEEWDDEYVVNLRNGRVTDDAKNSCYLKISGIDCSDDESWD